MSLELPDEFLDQEIGDLLDCLKTDVQLTESCHHECVVCGEIQNQWECYQLPCLHYGHTRCLRKWIATKKKIYCPWCGVSTPQKKYCHKCQNWTNHCDQDYQICPIRIKQNIQWIDSLINKDQIAFELSYNPKRSKYKK